MKFTYYGDCDLNGNVDGSDYSRLDSAFLADRSSPNSVTGWFNGDFNYDNTIEGSDYTLADNAFNRQGAQLTAAVSASQIAASTAVPEPVAVGMLAVVAMGSLGRRRGSGFNSNDESMMNE